MLDRGKTVNLTFRYNYWDSPDLKSEFIRFLKHIHNLDLSRWGEAGYWDQKYRPFSFFDGNRIIASLCVYSMEMMVKGEPRLVAQISGVGTLEEYRRQGLNRDLTERAIHWARANHDFFFLFAYEDTLPFYSKCGFRRVTEHKACMKLPGQTARPGAEKLDVQNKTHRDLIYRLATEREPASNLLGVYNKELFMFWCLYFLTDNIYYIAELDTLILYECKDKLVSIFDIVGKKVPGFAEIYPFIGSANDQAVEFLFMTDKMNLNSSQELQLKPVDNGTHLLGDFPFEGRKFIFPFTAHA